MSSHAVSRKLPARGGGVRERSSQNVATRVREKKGQDIWMMGGARIIASFLDLGER